MSSLKICGNAFISNDNEKEAYITLVKESVQAKYEGQELQEKLEKYSNYFIKRYLNGELTNTNYNSSGIYYGDNSFHPAILFKRKDNQNITAEDLKNIKSIMEKVIEKYYKREEEEKIIAARTGFFRRRSSSSFTDDNHRSHTHRR